MSWKCPYGLCDGSGFVYDEVRNIATDCQCRPQMLAAARAAKLRGRIPDRYRHVDFDQPPVTDMPRSVVRVVQRYVDDLDANLASGNGLWFQGPPGTGKTTLAMLTSKIALARGRSVAVYSVPRLLAELRDTFDAADMSATQLIDRLTAVELLHLDDLGAERTSAWVLEQLYSLINARYEAERAVLVTTNLEREELIEQIGARSVSRLTEMCQEIPLHGEDHRLSTGLPSVPASLGRAASDPVSFEAQRIAEMREIGGLRAGRGAPDPASAALDPHDPAAALQSRPAPARGASEPPSYWDRRDPWPPAGE